ADLEDVVARGGLEEPLGLGARRVLGARPDLRGHVGDAAAGAPHREKQEPDHPPRRGHQIVYVPGRYRLAASLTKAMVRRSPSSRFPLGAPPSALAFEASATRRRTSLRCGRIRAASTTIVNGFSSSSPTFLTMSSMVTSVPVPRLTTSPSAPGSSASRRK